MHTDTQRLSKTMDNTFQKNCQTLSRVMNFHYFENGKKISNGPESSGSVLKCHLFLQESNKN